MEEAIKMRKRTYWTTDSFKEKMKEINSNIEIFGEYVNGKTPIDCKCKICGHHWSPIPESLLKGHGCKKCADLKLSELKTKTHNQFMNDFNKKNTNAKNLEIIGTYINAITPIETRCKIHNYIWFPLPDCLLSNHGCPICGHTITVTGINDIMTTNPELVEYFVNKEDVNRVCAGSNVEIWFKCPNCGYKRKMKVNDFVKKGFRCHQCGSGESYPNKFSRALLKQLPVNNLIYEYSPDWIGKKSFDNYFEYNGQSYILEMDGEFHYKDNNYKKQSVSVTLENDRYKQNIAEEHGIKVIRIDCEKPEFNYIKKNIESSELSLLFDLSSINWTKCERFAVSKQSKLFEICAFYNNVSTDKDIISSHFHIGTQQIGKYLRKGYRLGLTDYSPEKAQKDKIEKIKQRKNKPVNVIKNNKLLYSFNSINECASKMKHLYNLYFKPSFISKCCEKIIEEYKGFKFEYAKNI